MKPIPDFDAASLDALFDQFPHQVWIADREGIIHRTNRRLDAYFGRRFDEAGRRLLRLVAEEDAERVATAWDAAAERGVPFQVEARLVGEDGTERLFVIAASPFPGGAQGGSLWYGTNTDIDDAHRARAELERALHAQRRALATANYDLRQPLSAILFLLAALQQRITEEVDRRMLDAINNAVQTIKTMVDNQLDFVRLNTNSLRVELQEVPVNGILTRLAIEFAPLAAAKGLSFSVYPCSALVRTDPQLLERMARNLLSNAVRYTRQGRVVLGCRRVGGRLRLEVHDTGRGVAADEVERLTEPFFRSTRSTLEHPGGLGLGLAIVDRVARALDHELAVCSRPGHGSVFSIAVPLAAAATATPRARLSGRRVLVLAGDEPVPVEAMERLGCTVVVATDEAQAVALLEEDAEPDIVLCGLIHDRVADGTLRLRRLINVLAQRGAETRALLASASMEPLRQREMVLSGHPFLTLPLVPEDLETRLIEVVAR
ncbi:ATP-binding response regulator [Arenibaculum pallidiluteum]|uniref:ATP-binding response regulator n=1 Tax=Arenibaculum pallidiluteum TaxID=2812559 RepID=UPI001A964F69|nr:ATP-binding protein [Arenibaculum pallidiluteum]